MARGTALCVVALLAGIRVARGEVITLSTPEVAVADRVLCPAEAADAAITLGPSGGGLVAWLDWRNYTAKVAVMAARIDANGALLDPEGIFVGAADVAGHVAVAFDGSHYLVAWTTNTNVLAARVAPDGTVFDTAAIVVGAKGDPPAVAGGNGQFLVTWVVGNTRDQVLAARVGDDGSLLDTTPLTLGSGAFVKAGLSTIFDGTNYVTVWSSPGIQAARVSPAGTVIAPGKVDLVAQIIGSQPTPSIVFDGTQYLVAWDEGGIKQMRVSTSMIPLDSPVSSGGQDAPPSVVFDGTKYTLAAEEGISQSSGRVELYDVSTANVYLGVEQYSLPGRATSGKAHLLYNGTQLLLGFLFDLVVGGTRVATDGTIVDATPLTWSQTKNDQYNPAIAFDGTDQYMVAWADSRDIGQLTSIVVARVSDSGGMDGSGIRVASGVEHGGKIGQVALARPATPGSTALVVWDEAPAAILAARVDGSGNVLDATGISVGSGTLDDSGQSLVAGCVDTTCLVVWEDSSFNIRGVRVALDGTIIDSTPLAFGSGISPRVTASNDSLLVTGGTPTLVPVSGAPRPVKLPASLGLRSWDVGWDGQQFLMVWSDKIGAQFQLHAGRFDANGNAIGSAADLASVDASVFVHVVYDGKEWIVIWYPFFLVDPESVSAARIGADGVVRDPGGVAIATGTGVSAFAGGSDGRFVMLRQVTNQSTPDRGTVVAASWISLTGSSNGSGGGGCCRSDGGGSSPAVVVLFVLLTRRRPRR